MELPPDYFEAIAGGQIPMAKIHNAYCVIFLIAGVVDIVLVTLMDENLTSEVDNMSTRFAIIIGYIIGGLSILNALLVRIAIMKNSRRILCVQLVSVSITVIFIASALVVLYNAYDVKSTNFTYNSSMNAFFFFYILQFLIFVLNSYFVGREVWSARFDIFRFRNYHQFENHDAENNIPPPNIAANPSDPYTPYQPRSSVSSNLSEASSAPANENPPRTLSGVDIVPGSSNPSGMQPPNYEDVHSSVPLPSMAGDHGPPQGELFHINPIVALPSYSSVTEASGSEARRNSLDTESVDSTAVTRDRTRSLDSVSSTSSLSISDSSVKKKAPLSSSSSSSLSSNAAAQLNPHFNNEKEQEAQSYISNMSGAAAAQDVNRTANMRTAHELYKNAMKGNKPQEK